jgi:hypothetical protein
MSDSENTPSKPVTLSRRDVLRKGLLLAGGVVATQVSDSLGATQYGIGGRRDMAEGIKDFFGLGNKPQTNDPYATAPRGDAAMKVLTFKEGPKTAEVFVGVDGPVDQITITDTSRQDPRDPRKPFKYTVHVDTARNEATTLIAVKGSTPGVFGLLETVHTNISGTRGSPHLRSAKVTDTQGEGVRIPANAPVVKQAEKDLATALDLGAKAKGAANPMQQNVADASTTRVENLSDGGVKLVRTFAHRNLPGGKVTHEIPMSPGTHDTTGLTLELVNNLTQFPDYKKMNPQSLEVFSKAAINTMLWEAQKIVAPPPRNDAVLGNTVNLDRVKITAPELKGRSANDLNRDVPKALEDSLNNMKGGASYGSKAEETWSSPGQTETKSKAETKKSATSEPTKKPSDASTQWRDLRGPKAGTKPSTGQGAPQKETAPTTPATPQGTMPKKAAPSNAPGGGSYI